MEVVEQPEPAGPEGVAALGSQLTLTPSLVKRWIDQEGRVVTGVKELSLDRFGQLLKAHFPGWRALPAAQAVAIPHVGLLLVFRAGRYFLRRSSQ